MKNLDKIAEDLFNKVRSRFTDIKLGDETGAVTTDAASARFFDLNFKTESEELGRVNIKLDEVDGITVIFNDGIVENYEGEVKSEWFNFLKEMRQFARRHLLSFNPRNITKSNLEKNDYQYLAQSSGETKMSESKMFGTSKTSYQDVGEAKIIVKHSQPVNYNVPAGRTQHIEAIYIESSNGERFKYPHRHLNGARAMAVHVANGGTAYDTVGSYISGLSEELSKLRQFKNYTQRSGVMAEALGDIRDRVMERIDAVKAEVANLQKQSYYEQFKEGFQPSEVQEVPEDMVNSWVDALTIKTFNEELKSVFPYIYKLVAEKQDGLTYDDLVQEGSDVCEVCESDPCSCDDDKVKEHNHLADLEKHLDELTTFEYDLPQEQEEQEEQVQPESSITMEVMEYIRSFYDQNTGSFPRGEEGVKIAVEKKFGEQAGQFAHFVVEKMSAKTQEATQELATDSVEQPVVQQEPTELLDIRRLAGI